MAVQEIRVDAVGQVLQSALRGLDIERRRQSSSLHLLSSNRAQVGSLLLALKQLDEVYAAIQKYLGGEVHDRKAMMLLEESIGNAVILRTRLWPNQYRACEALTRMIDILMHVEHSLLPSN